MKMVKILSGKARVGYSIDKDVYDQFQIMCKQYSINRSLLVNNLLRDYLNKRKKMAGDENLLK